MFEHNVHFAKAHNVLLYIANLILEICDISGHSGGCKCSVVAIPISIKIKSTSGKLIKQFSYSNIQSMDKKSLAKVLHGGYNALAWALDEEEDEDKDEDDNDDNDNEGSILSDDSLGDESCLGSSSNSDTNTFSFLLTSYTPDRCTCSLHAHHWSSKVNKQCHHLCTLLISYFCTLFKLNPLPNLYISIIELSNKPELTSIELLKTLSDLATSSLSAFTSALTIYTSEGNVREIVQLLNTHAHLLRPQDMLSYQAAVVTMAEEEVLDKGAMMVGFPVPVPLNGSDINKNDLDTEEGGLFHLQQTGI
ncbi:hypothetical protein GYMLUDRAFT_253193 [Collybiopsis luxurians FD-317 M1]|uniref:Uncharacterized protein n=1 Tax=Collybiopsis luxurians FD-317 M1 TaxID=944289 RepID=A0A0D0BXI7_9AGAR|nr:hypothetical protein GYMLUDRAFT_253193 [Collybiopsis luxurians FD-317 M1]